MNFLRRLTIDREIRDMRVNYVREMGKVEAFNPGTDSSDETNELSIDDITEETSSHEDVASE